MAAPVGATVSSDGLSAVLSWRRAIILLSDRIHPYFGFSIEPAGVAFNSDIPPGGSSRYASLSFAPSRPVYAGETCVIGYDGSSRRLFDGAPGYVDSFLVTAENNSTVPPPGINYGSLSVGGDLSPLERPLSGGVAFGAPSIGGDLHPLRHELSGEIAFGAPELLGTMGTLGFIFYGSLSIGGDLSPLERPLSGAAAFGAPAIGGDLSPLERPLAGAVEAGAPALSADLAALTRDLAGAVAYGPVSVIDSDRPLRLLRGRVDLGAPSIAAPAIRVSPIPADYAVSISADTGLLYSDREARRGYDLLQSVEDRILTPLGSRPLRPNYGSLATDFSRSPAEIADSIVEALAAEPRIDDVDVTIAPGVIIVDIDGRLRVEVPTR